MRQKPNEEKKKMFLQDLYPQYRAYRLSSASLAKTTRANYAVRVKRLLTLMGESTTVADLNRATITKALQETTKASPTGGVMYTAALHDFCRWLIAEGWLRSDPCESIPLPKSPKKRRKPVPEDALPRLMEACDRLPRSDYRRTLAKAAFSLLVYGAMRSSEVSQLRVQDVHLDTGECYIRFGKGGKPRTVYLCKEAIDAVKEVLNVRIEANHDLLLAQTVQYGMMPYALRRLICDLHTIAGLEGHYTPHQLRHACASRLLNNGAPITAIQAFLGHSRPEITFHYLHSSEQQLKDIAHLQSLNHNNPKEEKTEKPKTPAPSGEKAAQRFRVRRLR